MLAYLLSKATKAGYKAYLKGGAVVICLPMSFFGHDHSVAKIEVRNAQEYRALMGDF